MYGLDEHVINKINDVFRSFEFINDIVMFGSRVKGTYRNGSDIDLCIMNSSLGMKERLEIEHQLDELLLPYQIDLVVYDQIKNKALLDHIDRVGHVIYKHKA